MKLILAGDLAQATPVLPIRWCLSHSEIDKLKKGGAEDGLSIIFVIAYEDSKLEDRQIVPVEQLMTYLNFRRPGTHRVFAKIIWGTKGVHDIENLTEKWSRDDYKYNLLNDERTGLERSAWLEEMLNVFSNEGEESIEVSVPVEHFPKEPPVWLKKIVNFEYSYPAFDQCEFKKRLGLTIPRYPLLLLRAILSTIIRISIAIVLGLNGREDLNFKSILHPFRDDIDDVYFGTRDSETWFHQGRSALRYLLHPVIYLWLFAGLNMISVWYGLKYKQIMEIGWRMFFFYAVSISNGLVKYFDLMWPVFLTAIILLAILLVLSPSEMISDLREYRKRRKDVRNSRATSSQEKKKDRANRELYEALSCKPNVTADISALPEGRRTLRLKYLNLKAKICRPYASS